MKNKKKLKKLSVVDISEEQEIVDMSLFNDIRTVLNNTQQNAFTAVNAVMIDAYWHIGRLIVERQGGEERAVYGDKLISGLSKQLTTEYGKGFTTTNLRYMRQFYLIFQKGDALQHLLSWTHYRLIMKVENPRARDYYLEECAKGNWSTRQLERQINSFCYERVLSSKNPDDVRDEIIKKEPNVKPINFIKDPYVLEFLGLKQNDTLYETELEQALITHLQKFLLELGTGFTFEARQKRISFDGRHFYIDLVFYHYVLKCFVLIDIKTGDLTHQDIGQMQMYVNYYTRELMNEGDNPPIGIILCADKSESIVKYTFPEGGNSQVFTSKYKLYIPSEEEFAREITAKKELLLRENYLANNDIKK